MTDNQNDTKTCPFCAESIKAAASVCRFCGRDLPVPTKARPKKGSRSCLVTFIIVGGVFTGLVMLLAVVGAIADGPSSREPFRTITITATSNSFVKQAPSKDAEVGRVVKVGETMKVSEYREGWFKTADGWVAADMVSVDWGSKGPPTPTPIPSPTPTPVPEHDDVDAWLMCKRFVEQQLKSPSSADFPHSWDVNVIHLGDGRYTMVSYVDSQNGFGAMLRTEFRCRIHYEGNDRWTLDELTFFER